MIYTIARMMIPFEKLGEALSILTSVTQRSRAEQGCIRSNVYRDAELENEVMLQQVWKNEEDLAHHLRSDEFHKVLLVAEMALTSPEIRFDTVVRTTGIETVEKARTVWPKERAAE